MRRGTSRPTGFSCWCGHWDWSPSFCATRWAASAKARQWRAEIAALPAGPRLVRTLLRLAAPGPAAPIDVGLDQTELGQAAGLARSTIAVELARLRAQGIVATSRRRITITDIARLRTLAESGHGNV